MLTDRSTRGVLRGHWLKSPFLLYMLLLLCDEGSDFFPSLNTTPHDAKKKTHTRHKSPMAMHMALQFIWAGVGREERQLQLECRMWSFFYLIEKCFRVDAVLHDGWCYVGISRRGRIESLRTESETHTCTVERAISLPDGEGKRKPPQLPQAASGGNKLIYTVRRQMQ